MRAGRKKTRGRPLPRALSGFSGRGPARLALEIDRPANPSCQHPGPFRIRCPLRGARCVRGAGCCSSFLLRREMIHIQQVLVKKHKNHPSCGQTGLCQKICRPPHTAIKNGLCLTEDQGMQTEENEYCYDSRHAKNAKFENHGFCSPVLMALCFPLWTTHEPPPACKNAHWLCLFLFLLRQNRQKMGRMCALSVGILVALPSGRKLGDRFL